LVYKGKIQKENLAKSKISIHKLLAAIREHGVKDPSNVDIAML